MKHKLTGITLFVLLLFCNASSAQTTDPWITQAYRQLYQRAPTASEANIRNYNYGTWSNYCELIGYIAGYNRSKPGSFLKGDPWLFQAYCELFNRTPNAWELNIMNYNNGSWANYAELKNYVQQYQTAMNQNSIQVVTARAIGNTTASAAAVAFMSNNRVIAANLIGNDAGSILARGGQEMAGRGITRLVGPDGASLVGPDGGSLISNLPGVSFSNYDLKSTEGAKVIPTAGKTTLIIK